MPAPYLEIFDKLIGHDDFSDQSSDQDLKLERISENLASKIKSAIGQDFREHDLIHSFANNFMLRWFAAFHGIEGSENFAIWNHLLFQNEELNSLKKIFHGFAEDSPNAKTRPVSHPLIILSRLLGHGSPKMSVEAYLHILPFIGVLFKRKKAVKQRMKINKVILAHFLTGSRKYLSMEENEIAEKKEVSPLQVLALQ